MSFMVILMVGVWPPAGTVFLAFEVTNTELSCIRPSSGPVGSASIISVRVESDVSCRLVMIGVESRQL